MKKQYFLILSLLCLFLFLTACGKDKTSSSKQEEKKEPTYSFYKKENETRYEDYKEKNPNLLMKDVIIRVNIGLDYPFYTNTKKSPYLNTSKLLVNKYFYLGEDYVPNHLVELDTSISKGGISLVEEASIALRKLIMDAKNDGYTIRAMSAYRSYQYQVNLYNNYVSQDGREDADTYSARPGFSEHQTGLCVDVDNKDASYTDFESTKEFGWMQEHAADYGFILRYPKGKEAITGYQYESWHYRYVGEKIAKYIKEHDITFDEYYMEFIDK